MAGMMVNIGANVQSATKGIKDVSLLLSDQKAILKQLQLEYAKLDTAAARSKSGQLIANDIKIAKAEIQRLGAVSASSFGQVGQGATKALSGLRTLAHILPGLGIAGIFNVVFSGIERLFNNTSDAAEKLKQKIAELIRPLSEIQSAATAGTEEALSKVRALSTAVLDQSLSYEKRNRALAQLKEINKEYFGDLTVETAMLGGLKSAVEEYTNAVIANAVIKAFSEDIGKLSVELSKQLGAYNDLGDAADKANRDLANFNKTQKNIAGTALPVFSPELTLGAQRANKALQAQGSIVSKLSDQLGKLKTSIQLAVNEFLNFKPLTGSGGKPDPIVLKPKVEVRPELGSIDIVLPTFLDPKEDLRSRIQKQFSALFTELNLKIPVGIDLDTPGKSFQNLQKQASANLAKIREQIIADANAIANTVSNILAPAFSSFFNSILEGKDPLKAFFNSLIQSIQQLISQLIAAAIKALVLRAITGGAVGGIGGIVGALTGRASGGPVHAGIPVQVGEFGKEIFVPGESGRIIPNNKLSGVAGGANTNITLGGYIEIDGRKLKLILARQGAYDTRNV